MRLEVMNGGKAGNSVTTASASNSSNISKLNGFNNKQFDGIKLDKDFIANLPVRLVEDEVLKVIKENEVCIIIGETGSGKSTQIPQICLDAGLHKCPTTGVEKKIIVTQPRRIAASALAKRVASERNVKTGTEVGFKFRFENVTSNETKLIYATDGILLADAMKDPFLTDYSMVIIDEAHERGLSSDTLLMILKILNRKKEKIGNELSLRIVIMSATVEAEKFSKFFNNAKIFAIEGRTYETKLFYLSRPNLQEGNMVSMCVDCVLQLDKEEPVEHDFLVFLPGFEEINSAVKLTAQRSKEKGLTLIAFPLYASLSLARQAQIYQKQSKLRKVIYATNIAETSITIPGIRVVIDSGKVRQKEFVHDLKYDKLVTVNVSQAQAMQRAGRAGRENAGKCYRLYSLEEYNKMLKMPVPEVLRSNLTSVILTFLKIGMKQTKSMSWLDSPSKDKIMAAMRQLKEYDLITKLPDKGYACSERGNIVSEFPIDPVLCLLLFKAEKNRCLVEAITILAFLSSDPVFTNDSGDLEDKKADEARRKFSCNEGDLARMLSIYSFYKSFKKNKNTSLKGDLHRYGLNEVRLGTVFKVRKQINTLCLNLQLKMESCGQDLLPLRKSVAEAWPYNLCLFDPEINGYRLASDKKTICKVHPTSCLAGVRAHAIVFSSMMETTERYAKDVTLVDPSWFKHIS
uniref:RNA helicase n=1 Tax=Panagrolaimus superbus TaxID=310955 RepID=A0A914YWZ1_9BILA